MAASVQFRPQNRDLGMVMREVDEDLAIFLGIRNVEMEKNDHFLVQECDQFDEGLKCAEPQPVSLLTSNASQAEACLVVADDNFLDLEMERSDLDWLLKQPDSSLVPSLDADVQDSATSQTKISNGEDIILKSELEKSCEKSASLSESSSPLPSVECSTTVSKRSSSSEERKPSRRAATPTGRQPSSSAAKSKPSRASTPTSRATLLPSSKPVAGAQVRSSTPIRPTSRSSTPASRPSIPIVAKSGPRSATPTRKPATPSTIPTISAQDRSSSRPSRGAFPAVKSRPSKPSDRLALSQDAHQNPKVSMPKRPASASRGRMTSQSSSSDEKPRQKSCSPAKVRASVSTTAHKTESKMLSRSRGYNNVGDDVNPVVMGTKMVDRVVNMRKLAPPKQDEHVSQENPKKSSQENSGFGRSLSKKSLEMAIRHMDIRRSVPDKSRTSASAAAGSVSGCGKNSTAAAPESPQTSNSDSSKSSSCRSSYFS